MEIRNEQTREESPNFSSSKVVEYAANKNAIKQRNTDVSRNGEENGRSLNSLHFPSLLTVSHIEIDAFILEKLETYTDRLKYRIEG